MQWDSPRGGFTVTGRIAPFAQERTHASPRSGARRFTRPGYPEGLSQRDSSERSLAPGAGVAQGRQRQSPRLTEGGGFSPDGPFGRVGPRYRDRLRSEPARLAISARDRNAAFTAAAFGNNSATSGSRMTTFELACSRATCFPRTNVPKSERRYSGRTSSVVNFLAFFTQLPLSALTFIPSR